MEWGRPSSSSSSSSSRLVVLLCLLSFLLPWRRAVGETWGLSQEEERELERELKSLNKPYIKTFKEHGITYDCVDVYKQPALDHPLLKNHTLQLKSTFMPKGMVTKSSSRREKLPEKCPSGTVLIRRTTKDDLIRRRQHKESIMQSRLQPSRQGDGTENGNHYAGLSVQAGNGPKFYGAMASLDVKKLSGIPNSQASSAEIIVSKGEGGPKNYINAMHTGYQVDHLIQGDNLTHFFIYWTSDGYQNTGCYNTDCRGFVQLSTSLNPGMIYPLNYLTLSIFRDAVSLNWMLYNDRRPIGYWPKELFNNMADASQVRITGVVNSPLDEPSPPMGSGKLADASFEQIGVMNGKGSFERIPNGQTSTFNDLGRPYYDVYYNSFFPHRFSYGGPGGWRKT